MVLFWADWGMAPEEWQLLGVLLSSWAHSSAEPKVLPFPGADSGPDRIPRWGSHGRTEQGGKGTAADGGKSSLPRMLGRGIGRVCTSRA